MKQSSKLYGIYLIDSIVTRVDSEPYRKAFGIKLPGLIHHVFTTTNRDVREKLRIVRQSWENVFSGEYLQAVDDAMRQIDPYWPSYHQRQLLAQLNGIKIQMARMQEEVTALELEASKMEKPSNEKPQKEQRPRSSPKMSANTSLQTHEKSQKRSKRTTLPEQPLPKQKKLSNGSTGRFNVLSESSVLLTPSPEPCDRSTPPTPTPMINGKKNKSENRFRKPMEKLTEKQTLKMINIFGEIPNLD